MGSNAPTWYLYDGLGSVLGTVDQNGNVTSARKYDVYGAVRQLTGGSGTRHKFVGGLGHPSDDETGLIYMRARYYDPVTGRFISEDPAASGNNWFVYASNNPVNLLDSTGKSNLPAELKQALGRMMYITGLELGALLAAGAITAACVKNHAAAIGLCALAVWVFQVGFVGVSWSGYQFTDLETMGHVAITGVAAGNMYVATQLIDMAAQTTKTNAGRHAAVAIIATAIYGVALVGAIQSIDGFQ